jgi:DNA (cytosine-5)-methyltransferase 1
MTKPFTYLSVCSGIEAASVAWEPLGWRPAGFAEIDPFACHVLAHRQRATRPMFMPAPEAAPGFVERRKRMAAIKAVAGLPDPGTPNLTPNFGDLEAWRNWPDAAFDLLVGGTPCQSFSVAGLRQGLDDPRGNLALVYLGVADRYRPRWLVWENVPGVLSSGKGRDFGAFLGGLGELGYGWAYRVLDAQYVRTCRFPGAVPQRRRRVFVVGYLGDWRPAAAVLFDPESLRGNPPPGRRSRQDAAPTLAARPTGGGGLGTDFDLDGGLIPAVSSALAARDAKLPRAEDNVGIIAVAHSLRGDGFDASEDGTGRGTPLVPIAFSAKDYGADAGETAPTLRAMNNAASQANGGAQIAIAIQERAVSENPAAGPDGAGFRQDGAAYTLEARTVPQAVAFDLRGRDGGAMPEGPHDTANLRAASGGSSRSYVAQEADTLVWAVRRLTPRECERLQGFPDDYTDVPYRRRNWTPDGPRYKALGNSMAVNVMGWLGERIETVEGNLQGTCWE